MLPSFHKLGVSSSFSSSSLDEDESFVVVFDDMTTEDQEFAREHDLTAIEVLYEKSLPIEMKRMRMNPQTSNRKQKTDKSDYETLRKKMFGLGPYTPSTMEEVRYLLSSADSIYQAKTELVTFMHNRRGTDMYDFGNEKLVFFRILMMLRYAFEFELDVETYQLYTEISLKNVDAYFDYLKNLQRRLNNKLNKLEKKNPDAPKMMRIWNSQFNLMDTRELNLRGGKVIRVPQIYVRDAVKTLFYFVKLHDSLADTVTLMPERRQNVSFFGMNAKTWHAVQVPQGSQWAWLALLPLNSRQDYEDDLSDPNLLKVHLQHDTSKDETPWSPDLGVFGPIPLVLVFQKDMFRGYYYYVGYTQDETRNIPPRVLLRRISPVQ